MKAHPIRLMPGDDLRGTLEAWCRDHLPRGAFVVSGIGSLSDPCLRLAGEEGATRYAGPFEILTLAGTVTTQGAHLHMSIASATGHVFGGHVVRGNRVRTTVELLLVDSPDWTLGREPDAATGSSELVVR
jgi:predicted DNA-binding protein with PD1-like motif